MDEEYKNRQKAIASDVEIFASLFGKKYTQETPETPIVEKKLETPIETPAETPIVEKKLETPIVLKKKPKKKKQQKPLYTYDSDYDNGYDIDDKYLDMEDKYA